MIEITVAIFVISVGMMGVATSMDSFQKLIGSSSKRNVAAHVAQQELEKLSTIGYKDLVLAAAPVAPSPPNPKDPRSGVVGGQYRPSPDAALQNLVVDPANTEALAGTRPWSEDGVSGQVYRFVTRDPTADCGSACPKRLTVAVTITTASGNQPDPVTASTVVSEAQSRAADETVTPPPPGAGPSWLTFYPTDTKAAPPLPGTRVEPNSSHVVHESDKFPDLAVTEPPPNPTDPATPPLYKFSNPLDAYTAAEFPGGRILKTDGSCGNYGDKNKVHWWVTKPLASNITLTGTVGATVFSQILGQTPGNVILCLTVYRVVKPLKADGSFDGGSTKLNGKDCTNQDIRVKNEPVPDGAFPEDGAGPIAPRPISFFLDKILGCGIATHEIPAGQRLAFALTARDKRPKGEAPAIPSDIPAAEAVVLYDHFEYPSSFAVETTAAVNP